MNRFAAFILILSSSSLMASDSAQLTEIFCQEWVTRREGHVSLSWPELVNHLEQRKLRHVHMSNEDRSEVERCVRRHQDEFEAGAFYLNGKELLSKTASKEVEPAFKPKEPVPTVTVGSPLWGSIEVKATPDADRGPASDDRWLHYGRRWKTFLEDLRKRYSDWVPRSE